MEIFILGLSLFFVTHLFPSLVSLRAKLIAKFGDKTYKASYALISLAGLVLVVVGWGKVEFQAIWQPPVWAKSVVVAAMLVAFYLFAAADMKSNIKRFTRHPMLLGILLWSAAHLLANGDLKSILLFGSFAVYSVIAMVSANLRGAKKQTEIFPIKKDIISVIAGLVGYAVFVLVIHPYVFKVPVI